MLALTALSAAPRAAGDVLVLRGGSQPLEGETIEVGDGGVTFEAPRGYQVTYTWDLVSSLETDRAAFRDAYEARSDVRDSLWRAVARLKRGDAAGAAPLLDALFADSLGRSDATAAVIAEATLRSRLHTGDRAGAMPAWLECIRLGEAGIRIETFADLPAVIDAQTGLCPAAPPAWLPDQDLRGLVESLQRIPLEGARTEEFVKRCLAAAVAHERLRTGQTPRIDSAYEVDGPPMEGSGVGVSLLAAFVDGCWSENSEDRRTAVYALSRWVRQETWLGSWSRFARGRAGLHGDDGSKRSAIIDLLSIEARYAAQTPWLAALGLVHSAEALEGMGRTEEAASVRGQLREKYGVETGSRG